MNIDFKSWNLYRRPVVTFPTMKFLGDVFGMGIAWVRANTFFSQALVFLADSLHPPTTFGNEQGYIPFECETAWATIPRSALQISSSLRANRVLVGIRPTPRKPEACALRARESC